MRIRVFDNFVKPTQNQIMKVFSGRSSRPVKSRPPIDLGGRPTVLSRNWRRQNAKEGLKRNQRASADYSDRT